MGRERILFAVALLAILIAMSDGYSALSVIEILVFGDPVHLGYAYLFFAFNLGLAVYVYAWSFLPVRGRTRIREIGTWLYLVALLMPPAIVFVFILGIIQNIFFPDPTVASQIGEGLGYAAAVAWMLWFSILMRRQVARRERLEAIKRTEEKARKALARSADYLDSSFHRHAVVEAAKALELAADLSMSPKPRNRNFDAYEWLARQEKLGVDNLRQKMERIRDLKAHGGQGAEETSEEERREIVDVAGRIVEAIMDREKRKVQQESLSAQGMRFGILD